MFILALSVFSGLTAFVLGSAPESLESLLPEWALYIWGGTLALGSAVALAGMASQSVNGIITEQIGNAMVAAATIFYSLIVLWVIGFSAIQTVGIILAWGLACALRWGQLQLLIRSAMARQRKQDIIAAVYAEIESRAANEVSRRQDRPGRRR